MGSAEMPCFGGKTRDPQQENRSPKRKFRNKFVTGRLRPLENDGGRV
jgi:hypothetical protein